jgi:PhnB protein
VTRGERPLRARAGGALAPNLSIHGATQAIEFYKRALDAAEKGRFPSPDGKAIWHAELRVGDSAVFLHDEMPGMGPPAPTRDHPAPVGFWIWVKDADAAYFRAVGAGAGALLPPADPFRGDRTATIADPFGHAWTSATHVKDMTGEEMRRAGEEFARSRGSRPADGASSQD